MVYCVWPRTSIVYYVCVYVFVYIVMVHSTLTHTHTHCANKMRQALLKFLRVWNYIKRINNWTKQNTESYKIEWIFDAFQFREMWLKYLCCLCWSLRVSHVKINSCMYVLLPHLTKMFVIKSKYIECISLKCLRLTFYPLSGIWSRAWKKNFIHFSSWKKELIKFDKKFNVFRWKMRTLSSRNLFILPIDVIFFNHWHLNKISRIVYRLHWMHWNAYQSIFTIHYVMHYKTCYLLRL